MANKGAAKAQSLNGVHPGVAMVQRPSWRKQRSVDEWISLLKKEGPGILYREHVFAQIKHARGIRTERSVVFADENGRSEHGRPQSALISNR